MGSPELEIAILCGGNGIRMSELTANRQKCMLEVEGRPILEHVLDQMADAFGRAKVYFLTGYRREDIFNYFRERFRNLDLEYIHAGEAIGTRLTLLAVEDAINSEPFLASAGDVIAKANELAGLVSDQAESTLGTILVASKYQIAETHGFATLEDNRVVKIEYPPIKSTPGSSEYRMMDWGIYPKRIFEYLKRYDVATVSEVLKNTLEFEELLRGKIYQDNWFHFIAPEDLRVSIKL